MPELMFNAWDVCYILLWNGMSCLYRNEKVRQVHKTCKFIIKTDQIPVRKSDFLLTFGKTSLLK